MKRKYTREMRDFFAAYIPGHTTKEVAAEFARRFGPLATESMIKAYKTNNKIRSGTPTGSPKGDGKTWPREVREWLAANNEGKTAAGIAELLNAKFGKDYTAAQVKGIRARMRLKSGLTGRFEKGHEPTNKGKKGYCPPGSEKGWFKKGRRPHNWVPVGTEAVSTDGYVKVKVGEPDKWRWKHKMVWEEARGKVPAKHVLIFKDGNRLNCSLDNLECISMAENSTMNALKLRTGSAEFTESALAYVKVKRRLRKLERKTRGE